VARISDTGHGNASGFVKRKCRVVLRLYEDLAIKPVAPFVTGKVRLRELRRQAGRKKTKKNAMKNPPDTDVC